MFKNLNILWVLTIINTTVLVLLIVFGVISMFTPQSNTNEETKKWVQEQIDSAIKVMNENRKESDNYVNTEIKSQRDYVNGEVKKLYDYMNKR